MSWAATALLFIPVLCFLPSDLNGSHFFADRLVIFVWLAALAAASGYQQLSRGSVVVLAVFAIAMTAFVLSMGQVYLRPVSLQLSQLESQPVEHRSQAGLLLPADDQVDDFGAPLAFYPAMWAGTSYFRRSGSVLLNTPWMDLPILPLGARTALLTATVPPAQLEDYQVLREALMASSSARDNILPRAAFILFAGPGDRLSQAVIGPILQSAGKPQLACAPASWYVLCQR